VRANLSSIPTGEIKGHLPSENGLKNYDLYIFLYILEDHSPHFKKIISFILEGTRVFPVVS